MRGVSVVSSSFRRHWLVVLIFVWAVTVTVFLFWRNPLPLPDRGHRCFSVASQKAAKAVVQVLGEIGGLPERFTFDVGPTQQTLLWDNTTVIILVKDDVLKRKISCNALSVAVADPRVSARKTALLLRRRGFTATIDETQADLGLVLLSSDAFDHWSMVFRRGILAMGTVKTRKLLD